MTNETGRLGAISPHTRGSALDVVVTTRSAVPALEASADGSLRIRVPAPPVAGAANAAVLRLLADVLDVPRSRIEIVSGASSRRKRLTISGMSPDLVAERLQNALSKRR